MVCTLVQDRAPFEIPSTRRNPLLADLFKRLGYMERRGSGFGKIIRAYEFQLLYQEAKKHTSNPPRHFFTIVLPNRNYGSQPETTLIEKVDTEPNTEKRTEKTATQAKRKTGIQAKLGQQIIQIIKQNNKITLRNISEMLGVSLRTLNRRISEMPTVKYIGSGYSGHWEIDDN